MSRTTVDLDDELVNFAKEELGTATTKDTLDAALRAVVQRAARKRFYELLGEGLHDVEDLDAWREAAWTRKDTA